MREFPLLETEHLLLRSLTLEDEADVFAIYSNPEVTRFRDVVTLANKSQARAVIQAFQAEFERDSGVRWAITERGTSRLIGLCGVGWYRHNLLEPGYHDRSRQGGSGLYVRSRGDEPHHRHDRCGESGVAASSATRWVSGGRHSAGLGLLER